ncbi:MAG: response regulator [Bdellovibrionota bacterium]
MESASRSIAPVLAVVQNEPLLKKPVAVVIDDDEATTLYLTEFLLEKGWAVFAFCSANEGIKHFENAFEGTDVAAQSVPCDILFTDLRMPELDGHLILKKVHELFPLLPVVLMTAYASVFGAVDAVHEGAFDYLPKPLSLVRISTLLSKVSHSS